MTTSLPPTGGGFSGRPTFRSTAAGMVCSLVLVVAVTLVLEPLSELDPGISSGVLYVLAVLFIANQWGLRLGLMTSALSGLALAYYRAGPTHSFRVARTGDVVAIVVLLVTSAVASVIADRARRRAADAEERLLLETELRRHEAERVRDRDVRASRARVLEAADAERRRVVHDLHDGAQQRLVQTVVLLKLARQALERGDSAGNELIGEALEHAEAANTELRDLARGILPRVLTLGGLTAGLAALASRFPLPIQVDVSVVRLPATVEATAYFVVDEALTNVAKHARGRRAWVTAGLDGDVLRVEIRDDGIGGADCEGTGLVRLRDRLAAIDGELRVASPAQGGTQVEATIPSPIATD
jgi:signal transduction histidine kinase